MKRKRLGIPEEPMELENVTHLGPMFRLCTPDSPTFLLPLYLPSTRRASYCQQPARGMALAAQGEAPIRGVSLKLGQGLWFSLDLKSGEEFVFVK